MKLRIAAGSVCALLQLVFVVRDIGPALAAEAVKAPAKNLAPAQLTVENVTIEVSFAPGTLALPRTTVLDWITASARAVAQYYGQFPVSHLRLLLTPVGRAAGVRFGTTFGGQDPLSKIWLGQFTEAEMLQRD